MQKLGFAARGSAAYGAASRQQVEGMQRAFQKAEIDFRAALGRNGKLIMAYEGLMGIGQFRGDKAMVEDAYRSALRPLRPASRSARPASTA